MKAMENGITLSIREGVFFNPNMEICRDICSLAIGAIGKKMDVCDSFCATGIRGIRYKKENKNVGKVHFVDFGKREIECAKRNAKANGVKGCAFAQDEVCRFLMQTDAEFDFLEIDPFGSPAPYIYDACRYLWRAGKGERHLSITATDTAVLCGAEHSACVKNYFSIPLHNELCHESGIRILTAYVQKIGAQFNLHFEPLFSLSTLHFFKIIFRVEQSAERAVEDLQGHGYILYEQKTLERRIVEKPFACKRKEHEIVGGPFYLGRLHSEKVLGKMIKENGKRKYAQKERIAKLLFLMKNENSLPPFHYDLHRIADRYALSPPKTDSVIERLKKEGFLAARTHFCPTAVKTTAELKDVLKAMHERLV